ncbi:MAG: CHAT domain-containing protein, partial [Deltaproteobacteria bacterium]
LLQVVAMRNRRALSGPAVVVEGEPAPPFAALEAEAIERLVPGSVVFRNVPDLARISDALRDAAILHLVAHTSAGTSGRQGRWLRLGPGRSARIDIRTILSFPVVPEMVVLSGCSTAAGYDGGLDLARAFLSKGARLVLGTLWQVSGAAGSMLVKRFYRELERHGPLVALRKAMDVTRRYYSHPVYWSGFALMGYGFGR